MALRISEVEPVEVSRSASTLMIPKAFERDQGVTEEAIMPAPLSSST